MVANTLCLERRRMGVESDSLSGFLGLLSRGGRRARANVFGAGVSPVLARLKMKRACIAAGP